MFSDRIDFGFLDRLVHSAEVGSLALVGPVQHCPDTDGAIARLRDNPKVHWFGAPPHNEIHRRMAGIDIAVISYAGTQLN